MSKTISTVVIGTSLTGESELVIRAGLRVARAAGARVVLVHAYPLHPTFAMSPYVPQVPELAPELDEAERRNLRRKLEAQAYLLGVRSEERGDTFVECGAAHQVLIAAARAVKADLIVVGAAEAPRLSKLLGSTADRVVRQAACPVLVVRRELPVPPARVLLPVDLSLLSAEALREGLALLGLLARDLGPAATVPQLEALYVLTDLDRHLFPETERTVREQFACFLALHAADSPFEVPLRMASGHVDGEILRRIQEWEPDLVVLGTHGRSGFERLLIGSVTTRVLQAGGSNLLIVPPAVAREHPLAARAGAEPDRRVVRAAHQGPACLGLAAAR